MLSCEEVKTLQRGRNCAPVQKGLLHTYVELCPPETFLLVGAERYMPVCKNFAVAVKHTALLYLSTVHAERHVDQQFTAG